MVIRIKDPDGPNLWIPMPTGLIFNRLTAAVAAKATAEYGTAVSARQMYRLFAAIKRYKRAHPDWVITEVQDADGTYVKIKL